MTIFGIDLLTILLVVGVVLLLTYLFMQLGVAALGVVALIGIIGAIFTGVGFIGMLGGIEEFGDLVIDLFRELLDLVVLAITTETIQIFGLVGL